MHIRRKKCNGAHGERSLKNDMSGTFCLIPDKADRSPGKEKEATKPASFNFLQQQERFDAFLRLYNNERPHQALNGACPGDFYAFTTGLSPARKPAPSVPRPNRARHTMRAHLHRQAQEDQSSQMFAGQTDRIWLTSFMDYDLGYFEDETYRLEPLPNPFGPKVLPMSPV